MIQDLKRGNYIFFKNRIIKMVGEIGSRRVFDYCKYFEALVAYHKFYGGQ